MSRAIADAGLGGHSLYRTWLIDWRRYKTSAASRCWWACRRRARTDCNIVGRTGAGCGRGRDYIPARGVRELLAKAISWMKFPLWAFGGYGLTPLQVGHEKDDHSGSNRTQEREHDGRNAD